jgi:hypothetical protein
MAQLDDELFYAKITNPETGQPYHWSDLDVSYRRHGSDKKYPTRQVNQIIHVRRLDGSEWLKSRGRIVGLDKAGNEVENSFANPDV